MAITGRAKLARMIKRLISRYQVFAFRADKSVFSAQVTNTFEIYLF